MAAAMGVAEAEEPPAPAPTPGTPVVGCGQIYWARHAFVELNAHHCADEMRRLVFRQRAASPAREGRRGQGPRQQQEGHRLEDGALLLARVHHPFAGGWAGGQVAGRHHCHASCCDPRLCPKQQQLPGRRWLAARGPVGSKVWSHRVVSCCLNADVSWVRDAISALGRELRRRMAAHGGCAPRL